MKVNTSGLRQDSPSRPLLQAFISYQGITDAAGAASGLTIVCGDLVNEPSYDGLLCKVRSGAAAGQVKPIYVQAGNTLTFATPWTNAAGAVVQITASTLFDILSISGGGGGPGPAPREGLSYYGVVDAVPGANQFTIGSLAGLGAGKFDGATNPYYAFVLRDAGGAGAAPQGEQLPITAYVTATGVFTTVAFTAAVAVGDEILILHPDLAAALIIIADLAGKPNVQEIIIYPVAEDAGVTELAQDGSDPPWYPAAAHSTAANAEGAPGVAWAEDINFEQEGAINIISIYAEFEWQTRFLVGAGAGTQSSSKIQISRDGGANWVDLTDNFNNAAAVMTVRIRAGVGLWIPTIVAGANQLQFRLVHWTDDGGAVSTSEAQIRSNSYVRVTYRKA